MNGHSRVAGHYIVFESLKWTILLNICFENVNRHSRVAGCYIRLVDVPQRLGGQLSSQIEHELNICIVYGLNCLEICELFDKI